jgi:hypothetical protein
MNWTSSLRGLLLGLLLSSHQHGLAQPRALDRLPADLQPLVRALEKARYAVFLAPPPIPGAYGATDPNRRLIWLAPITLDLGIARQTLIHEAVHAAQACPKGKLRAIGWQVPLEATVEREISGLLYRGYAHGKHEVEREAFAMQGQPQAIGKVISALRQRCR